MSQHSSRGKAWDKKRLAVLDAYGWVCAQCGKALEGSDATVDHIFPNSRGGTDDDENLVPMCRSCNGRKSDRTDHIRQNWFNHRWLTPAQIERLT